MTKFEELKRMWANEEIGTRTAMQILHSIPEYINATEEKQIEMTLDLFDEE